jgi:integrase
MLPRTEGGLRPAHRPPHTEYHQNVFDVVWGLKKQGFSDHTIRFVSKALTVIEKGCGLDDPERVKSWIAQQAVNDSYKRNLCYAYRHYLKLHKIEWERPKYYAREKLPKIPSEKTIDMIIAASKPRLALQLSISKETGLRPVELLALRVKDIDLEKGIVYPQSAKHGSPRALPLKSRTLDMLKVYLIKQNIGQQGKLFDSTSEEYAKSFRYIRNKVAARLQDPSLRSIRLYDLRHFFATTLYHKTKDILFVKSKMGHKRINTTLLYTQLVDSQDDEWTVKIASSIEEFTQLLESGFEYVSDYEGKKILRRRK